jgi:hypothetical protein
MFRKIVAHIAAKSAGKEMNRFFQATSNLKEVQENLLRRQMSVIAGSEFAKDYGLASVETYQDFCRKLPILTYDAYRPYIEKLKNGHSQALFNRSEKMVMFALTSGTTAEPKYIPVTKRFVDDYRRGWNIFGLKALLDHPQALMRKIIQITSSGQEIQTPCGLWAGAITGLLAATQKWIVRKHYTTPLSVARIKDPTAKMYTVARLAITEDVGFMNTANPSTTLRLAQTIEQYGPELIRDVRDGELRAPGEVPMDVLDDLRQNGRLKANPKSAARLSRILEHEEKLLPKNVWQMGFIDNWTGGTLKLYLQRFGEYFGDTPVRDLGLLASEGRFSVPINDHTPAGILEITSNFFEFIPESEYGEKNPTVLLPEQLKVGEKYFMLFSNATGFCRYNIGDLVRVVDFYNQTPMIEFLNKGAHISSLTGEKLTERQVVEAIEIVGKQMGSRIECFQVQPKWADPPYYVLTVEEEIAAQKSDELGRKFDETLSKLNIEYETKRSSGRLGCVQVRSVSDGYFRQDDLKRLSCCGRSEQYKRKFLITEIENSAKS